MLPLQKELNIWESIVERYEWNFESGASIWNKPKGGGGGRGECREQKFWKQDGDIYAEGLSKLKEASPEPREKAIVTKTRRRKFTEKKKHINL